MRRAGGRYELKDGGKPTLVERTEPAPAGGEEPPVSQSRSSRGGGPRDAKGERLVGRELPATVPAETEAVAKAKRAAADAALDSDKPAGGKPGKKE